MILIKDKYDKLRDNIKDTIEYARIMYFLTYFKDSLDKVFIPFENNMNNAIFQVDECDFNDMKSGHLFSNDSSFSVEFLKSFHNDEPLFFKCVPGSIYNIAKDIWDIQDSACFGLWYLPYDSNILEKDSEYNVESLRETDIDTVNRNWEFGQGRVSNFLKERIKTKNTFAVYIEDKLASYAVNRENGSMGMLRTIPEFRGLGLAKIITVAMLKEARKKGYLPHCYIDNNNHRSQNVAKSCGMKYYSSQYWFKKEGNCCKISGSEPICC